MPPKVVSGKTAKKASKVEHKLRLINNHLIIESEDRYGNVINDLNFSITD
ncbi:hypothetical protein Smp_125720 [Schistosoma mansoni]|nr:hypothetical protein Smp_125720 [Schistosoma mansoni]|eukprot:XP_018648257.1 hypothetical protein Smp_125720 [Schistosoma mansoni]